MTSDDDDDDDVIAMPRIGGNTATGKASLKKRKDLDDDDDAESSDEPHAKAGPSRNQRLRNLLRTMARSSMSTVQTLNGLTRTRTAKQIGFRRGKFAACTARGR